MGLKITLPISGLVVELAVIPWKESKEIPQKALKAVQDKKGDDYVEDFLRHHYPESIYEVAFKSRLDVTTLYNDTFRWNFDGPDAVKNSSRSGTGAPTQTE